MTKTIKKCLFVLCICLCAVTMLGFSNIFAKQVKAAYEDEFKSAITYLIENTSGDYKTDLANSKWANNLWNAYYYQSKPNFNWALVEETTKDNYDAIMAEDGTAVSLYVRMSQYNSKVNEEDGKRIYGSDLANITDYISIYDSLSVNEQGFVNKMPTKYYDKMLTAKERAEGVIERAALAVGAINNIYKNGDDKIVLNSRDTLNNAKDALDEVYGIDIETIIAEGEDVTAYIPNYNDYTGAEQEYAGNYALATAFVAKVNGILAQETDNVCYSLQGQVTDAINVYNDLPSDADNNLKGLEDVVAAKEELDGLQGRIDTVQGKIDAYIGLVDAIGDVEYDDETLGKIETAENAYGELPTDVLGLEEVVSAQTTETTARSVYNTMHNEVLTLIEQAEYFPTAYAKGEIEDKLLAFNMAYGEATGKQQVCVAETVLSYGKTVEQSVSYYNEKMLEAQEAAIDIINLIADLPEATVTLDFAEALVNAENAYENLDAEFKPYVTNYDRLQSLRHDYDELMQVVEEWENKVGAIEDYETMADVANVTTYFEHIAAAVNEYNNLDETVQEVIPVSYADEYNKYAHALKVKAAIEEKISGLVDAIGEIPTNIPSVNNPDALSEYVTAVGTANGLYEEMTDAIQAHFIATEADAYAALSIGINGNIVISVENLIALIGDPNAVTIASAGAISNARTAYNDMPDRKNEVENYQNLVTAETKLSEIAQNLDAWKNAVTTLRGGVEIDELWSVNLDDVDVLEGEYNHFTDDEKVYVAEGKAELDAIKAKSSDRINDLKNRINALPEVLTDEDLPTVEAIQSDYGKLHATQKGYVENYGVLETAYNKLAFVNVFEQAVADICEQIEAGKFVFEDNIEIYILKSVLNSASAELQALVSDETKTALTEAIAAYEGADVINVAEMKAALDNIIETAMKTADFNTVIADYLKTADFNTAIADYLKTADFNEIIDDYLKTADFEVVKAALEEKIKAEQEAREAADKSEKDAREAADAALDAKVDAEKDAREAADKAEKDAREATDKETSEKVDSAVANLQEQIDSLKNKTTIIIIAFAAVCVILSACVIILFIKRK